MLNLIDFIRALGRHREAVHHLQRAAQLANTVQLDDNTIEQSTPEELQASKKSRLVSLALCYFSNSDSHQARKAMDNVEGAMTSCDAGTIPVRDYEPSPSQPDINGTPGVLRDALPPGWFSTNSRSTGSTYYVSVFSARATCC